ncbi:Peptidyl-prolyl cis-trans isomerase PASTICCINO1 [Olea europaea subsp. europaea]|uniref:Peptidyl-prolyl cis-trans isomerase PASTICCINO1 n=1 Tax=Olea europaea subsp. europaea TaxID=158383 RepID=A0A8S0UUK5_OLEEU|nr:Peptidyl-prolyl cis-trans isomerase PASTICCINO1 [Olea europaea subsp. europaea]
MEMVQPYMDGVLYDKPQEPSLSRHSRSSKINRTVKKSKPCILMITDGRLGHSSDIDNDDDFVIHLYDDNGNHFLSILPWTLRWSQTRCHIDSCFYYIRQLALYGENVKYKATTTDSHFQAVIKHVYPHFKKDSNVLLTDTQLINDVTGVQLPLSCPWPKVDRVLMPILPTNKAHWMLALLDINERTMSVFNSARRTYPDLRVRADVELFFRVIPHLMRAIGLWNKDLDNDEGDSMELKSCLVMMFHNSKTESMPKEFDAARARLDVAAQLYKHRDIKKATKGGNERSRGA